MVYYHFKIYEERVNNNDEWPGYFPDFKKYALERFVWNTPDMMHFLDERILTRVLTKYNFSIEQISTFPRTDYPEAVQFCGNEGVGVVATVIK